MVTITGTGLDDGQWSCTSLLPGLAANQFVLSAEIPWAGDIFGGHWTTP